MAKSQNMGDWIWRLIQIGLVVFVVVVGSLLIFGKGKSAGELAVEDGGQVEEEKGMVTEFMARLRGLFRMAQNGPEDGGQELKAAQEEDAEAHIDLEKLMALREVDSGVRKQFETLADGSTMVDQIVFWQISGDQVYYRIVLTPYDRPAHQLMMDPSEALFISFFGAEGERLVPKAAAHRLETRTLRVATKDGYAAGWFIDGFLPVGEQDGLVLERAHVGWIFSDKLHARLRQIQNPSRAARREGREPQGIRVETGG